MATLREEYQEYVEKLEKQGAPLVEFDCPNCNAKIKTLSNETNRNWDTLSSCPECEKSFMKFTLAKQGGVVASI